MKHAPPRIHINVGDTVLVRPGFGVDPPIEVTVENVDSKNGRQLFDYMHNCISQWAYTDQIVRIIKRA